MSYSDTKQHNQHKKTNLKTALSMAAGALLGTGAIVHEAKAEILTDWQFDSAFLYYSEADRVTAAEIIVSANKTFANDEVLNVKLTIDSLTGASANGAVVQAQAQTFTRPSGEGQYVSQAGDTPLDDTFKDTRVQLNAQWTQPVAEHYTASIGGHLSKEFDYLSLGLNGNLALDFYNKNSTISLGFSHFQDRFTPIGGIPKPYASMLIGDSNSPSWHEDFAATRIASGDNKITSDVLVGFTQVINRRMITQFNYSYSMVRGYLTDPFKIVSVLNQAGTAQDYIYEHRPDERKKQSVFAQTKYHFDQGLLNSVLDFSYRYMWDDWQINSHTLDSTLHIPLASRFGKASYLQPHIRYYQQSAAGFYRPYTFVEQVSNGSSEENFISADYRIGAMTAVTLGLKYGFSLNNGNDFSVRLEYYRQMPNNAGFDQPSELANLTVYPVVQAVIFQLSYSFL
ncbi:hypothetical protein CMT41_08360 [Colwellia sp. MT41]|uniref:DUF3570 domain-containing protein n=1 Tax=Colwellia sp. MT41 TaxID=58049 RepID=UPI000717A7BA|nr:DUF3570 domain-containing protein [Colwellia sp. MT41]ALO34724.1 hypothetical protein CMT41_08360 [Colwellia sp. MT41]